MFAINPAATDPTTSGTTTPKCTPNLLPCRVHYDGPVNASRRYWNPQIGQDGKPEAYFRGRKLKGKEVPVPEGYRGVVVRKKGGMPITEGRTGRKDYEVAEDEGGVKEDDGIREEGEEEVNVLEEVATFEELVVWGHEVAVQDDHAVVKGVSEWIRFAEAMHAHDTAQPAAVENKEE